MKKAKQILVVFILFCILVAFASCGGGLKYPSLKAVNQYAGKSIKSVELVGYESRNLLIAQGDSQLFVLDKGMPGGYAGIDTVVGYGSGTATWYINKEFDFSDGEVTTITLKGSDAEGDPDYNNTRLE